MQVKGLFKASLVTPIQALFHSSSSSPDSCTCAMSASTIKLRSVKKILPKPSAHWVGDGFKVYPVFSNLAFTEEISPLLMFDYAEPRSFPPRATGAPLGVGQHPHRGFETVTIAFQGEVEHHDSTGKTGIIQPGDVQWMTAGRGIIHQEYHSKKFTKSGGTFEMCQLWVNLPKKHKMTKPGYQAIAKTSIPQINLPIGVVEDKDVFGTARIIAGELEGTKGKATTFSPVHMWDINISSAGSEVDLPFPADHNCILFVRRGGFEVISGENAETKASALGPQDVAVMRMDGSSTIRVRASVANSSLMVLGGEPLNEPIAARGPFVMNTQEQLREAMMDFQSGKMGK